MKGLPKSIDLGGMPIVMAGLGGRDRKKRIREALEAHATAEHVERGPRVLP